MEISLWAKAIKIAGEKILLTPTDVRTGNDGKPYVPAQIKSNQLCDDTSKAISELQGCTLWLHLPASLRVLCDDVEVHGGLGVPAWYMFDVETSSVDGKINAKLKSVAFNEIVGAEEI